jgi:hypothetical protein
MAVEWGQGDFASANRLPLTLGAASSNVATFIGTGRGRLLNAVEGGRLCGSITFRYEGVPNWTLSSTDRWLLCEAGERAAQPLRTRLPKAARKFILARQTR